MSTRASVGGQVGHGRGAQPGQIPVRAVRNPPEEEGGPGQGLVQEEASRPVDVLDAQPRPRRVSSDPLAAPQGHGAEFPAVVGGMEGEEDPPAVGAPLEGIAAPLHQHRAPARRSTTESDSRPMPRCSRNATWVPSGETRGQSRRVGAMGGPS